MTPSAEIISCSQIADIFRNIYRRNRLRDFNSETIRVFMRAEQRKVKAKQRRPEPDQLELWKKRGGKRRGAGRPPNGARAGSPHKQRPDLNARYPVHVTLRVVGAVGTRRRRCVYEAIRDATLTTARREDFRIVHASIQRTHVHLVVEADD